MHILKLNFLLVYHLKPMLSAEGRRRPRKLRYAAAAAYNQNTSTLETKENLSKVIEKYKIIHNQNCPGETKENTYYIDPRFGNIIQDDSLHYIYKACANAKVKIVIPIKTIKFIECTEDEIKKRLQFNFLVTTYLCDTPVIADVLYYYGIDHSFALGENYGLGYTIKDKGTYKLDPILFIKSILHNDETNCYLKDKDHPKFIGGYRAKYDVHPNDSEESPTYTTTPRVYEPISPGYEQSFMS